jgi:hypothetical protein
MLTLKTKDVRDTAIAMPARTQELACGKCGRTVLVSTTTILAFCRDCSATLGVKR